MKVLIIFQPVRTSRSVTAAPPADSFRQTERKDERDSWLFFTTVIPLQTRQSRPLKAKTVRLPHPAPPARQRQPRQRSSSCRSSGLHGPATSVIQLVGINVELNNVAASRSCLLLSEEALRTSDDRNRVCFV